MRQAITLSPDGRAPLHRPAIPVRRLTLRPQPGMAPLEALVNSLCMGLPFEPAEKQAFLEAPDLAGRFDVLTTLLEIDASDPDDERPQLQ